MALPGPLHIGDETLVDLDALIAGAKAALEAVEPVTQDVALGDEVVGVRVWPIAGTEWRELTVKHPPRPDAVRDRNMGYNLDAVARVYPRVVLVVDDVEQQVGERWAEIWDVLSAPDQENVALAIWGANEFEPRKRVEGKALTGGRKKKRSSPVSSASPSES